MVCVFFLKTCRLQMQNPQLGSHNLHRWNGLIWYLFQTFQPHDLMTHVVVAPLDMYIGSDAFCSCVYVCFTVCVCVCVCVFRELGTGLKGCCLSVVL